MPIIDIYQHDRLILPVTLPFSLHKAQFLFVERIMPFIDYFCFYLFIDLIL